MDLVPRTAGPPEPGFFFMAIALSYWWFIICHVQSLSLSSTVKLEGIVFHTWSRMGKC